MNWPFIEFFSACFSATVFIAYLFSGEWWTLKRFGILTITGSASVALFLSPMLGIYFFLFMAMVWFNFLSGLKPHGRVQERS